MERHEFENGTIIEMTNAGMLIKADNIMIDGENITSIESSETSDDFQDYFQDYVDNRVRYLEVADKYVGQKIDSLSSEIARLNKKISDLNYEKLETRSELEDLKAWFWSFVIVSAAVFFMLLIFLS